MNYLIAWHWGWLLAALIVGVIVGFTTFARPRTRWIDAPVIVAAILFAAAVVIALLRLVPDRAGYWLELGVLMVAAYIIGCFIGWLLKFVLAREELAPAVVGASVPAGGVAAPPLPAAGRAGAQPASAETPMAAKEPERAPALPDEAAHAGTRPIGYIAARTGKADNLKRIKGIGRKNEASLNALGIWNFAQIAAWTPDNVSWVGSYLAFPGRIDREQWVAQAEILAEGRETEFSRRVDKGEVETSRNES